MPPSRQLGGQELDGLLGTESPSKEVDSSCWGRKKKKKKKSLQEDTVRDGASKFSNQQKVCNVQIYLTLATNNTVQKFGMLQDLVQSQYIFEWSFMLFQ